MIIFMKKAEWNPYFIPTFLISQQTLDTNDRVQLSA